MKRRRLLRPMLEELEPRLPPATFSVKADLAITALANCNNARAAAHAVVFFESSVADYQILADGLNADTDAVVLDSGVDGLREMAAFLAGQYTNNGQPYPGTLFVDGQNAAVTFNVSSNFLAASNPGGSPTLPDDTYTVTLLSGAGNNGFQDISGQGFDDGRGGHADFLGTFTTTYQHDKTPIATDQAGSLVNITFAIKTDTAFSKTTVRLVGSKTVLADDQAAMILSPGLDWTAVLAGIG